MPSKNVTSVQQFLQGHVSSYTDDNTKITIIDATKIAGYTVIFLLSSVYDVSRHLTNCLRCFKLEVSSSYKVKSQQREISLYTILSYCYHLCMMSLDGFERFLNGSKLI